MKFVKYILVGLALSASLGCNSENEEDLLPEEEKCRDNTATLSGAVSTIIGTNCAVPGCHVSGTGRVNFTVKENIIQNAAQIRSFTQNEIMPPPQSGRTLSEKQKDDIFCWVENGAQDN
ncbi:MAG: 2-polyprenyl-6-methoxyphenol hydroxylase [Anditalea sp.]